MFFSMVLLVLDFVLNQSFCVCPATSSGAGCPLASTSKALLAMMISVVVCVCVCLCMVMVWCCVLVAVFLMLWYCFWMTFYWRFNGCAMIFCGGVLKVVLRELVLCCFGSWTALRLGRSGGQW